MANKTATVVVDAEKVQSLTAREEERFRASRRKSDELWRKARASSPRGVPSSFQDSPPQPIFVEYGRGSRVWDVDGNEYVDFHNGFGVMVVGHAHPLIVDAVSKRIARGSHFAQPVAEVAIVAEELAKRFGLPQWRFTNSGTESTLDAVRIARGFTGRERLVKIEASYHGHHDALMVSVEPPPDKMGPVESPASYPQSEGIPKAVVELTTVVPFNDLPAMERAFKKYPDEIALAKAIGGGLPCGAVGGRQDVMAVIEDKRVAQMGTFNGNPLILAAAKVTLQDILTPKAYAHFDALAEVLQGGLDGVIRDNALPFHVTTLTARGSITYKAERVRNYRDYLTVDKATAYLSWLYQCNRGVLM